MENNEEPRIENSDSFENSDPISHSIYANGPDFYVLSNRQNPIGAPAPQEVEDTQPKPKPEGPVCPQCGNAITNDDWSFCPECGTPFH
ncbi:MAG: zinc-ribbon domain-containing protein [Bacteroidales bacterium]|nr:zinc-ribbon domain-containing protein [Bacteroidales bacterium]